MPATSSYGCRISSQQAQQPAGLRPLLRPMRLQTVGKVLKFARVLSISF